jgi:integrase
MTDIRKREGSRGVTYQVRYATKASKTGYAYKSFRTLKDARHWAESELPRHKGGRHHEIRTVDRAVEKWLEICEHEGREGKDPVSRATLQGYKSRADAIKSYDWDKALYELEAADVVAFRSWLLKEYSRDQAKKILSSFHSVLLEMVTQGVLTTDPAAQVTIQQSRYQEPVEIPSVAEVSAMLRAADELAEDENYWIARAWKRYRPMIYLAADAGMRPQEYLALRNADVSGKGVRITQALDRSNTIGPPKTRAGRRFIPVSAETLELIAEFREGHDGDNPGDLCFPGEDGGHQQYSNFLRRGWWTLMEKAGFVSSERVNGRRVLQYRYTPYALRHFYASMLIAKNVDLKTIQERMGHQDAAMTLNVYGHLIRQRQAESSGGGGILADIIAA